MNKGLVKTSKQNTLMVYLPYVLLLIIAAIPVYGAFRGISTPDESFYLTIPYRLLTGDSLLVDEWHASQLSAFLQYLPMLVYTKIVGSTDGIILFFRLLYVFCQTLVCGFIYYRMRRFGTVCATIGAVGFMLYQPETVGTLDYYTMGLMGFAVVAVILFTAEKELSPPALIFCGIVFAGAVVSQPFNCLVYFAYTVAVVVFRLKKKTVTPLLSVKNWLFITVGVFVAAVVFILWLALTGDLAETLKNVGNLFSGEDHRLPFSEGGSDMFQWYVIVVTIFKAQPVVTVISLLWLAFALCFPKRAVYRREIAVISAVVFVAAIMSGVIRVIVSGESEDYLFLLHSPLFVAAFGIILYRLTERRNKRYFCIWCAGTAYVLCLGVVSQALDCVGSVGWLVSGIAVPFIVRDFVLEIRAEKTEIKNGKYDGLRKKAGIITPVVCCTVLFVSQISVGIVGAFSSDSTAFQFNRNKTEARVHLNSGAFMGISVSVTESREYYAILKDIRQINGLSEKRVLMPHLTPWIYLMLDVAPATFTTWYIYEEEYMFDSYFEDAEHIPDVAYVPYRNFYNGCTENKTVLRCENLFDKYFSYERIEGEAGYIYLLTPLDKE